jgi:hypothetical protein
MNQGLVYPDLPNAGLGNIMLVWAKAITFANINSLPVVAPNWNQIHIMRILKREKDDRYYGDFFDNQNYVSRFKGNLLKLKHQNIFDPPLAKIEQSERSSSIYI